MKRTENDLARMAPASRNGGIGHKKKRDEMFQHCYGLSEMECEFKVLPTKLPKSHRPSTTNLYDQAIKKKKKVREGGLQQARKTAKMVTQKYNDLSKSLLSL